MVRTVTEEERRQSACHGLTRREFLACSALTSAALFSGCAVNPVTGRQQLMLVDPSTEIQMDRQKSPHQFSADYGPVQDSRLNRYLGDLGTRMAAETHRPEMPYSFRVVNAAYVNAYAFPGGSIAVTRGILLNLESEAELAGLLGHELGHVNARHTAQRMTKGLLANVLVAGFVLAAGGEEGSSADLAAGLGGIAAGALLARYSRENERQADQLGMEYMVRAGYNPRGLIDLMDLLRSLHSRKPAALDLMFATHPMSDERYRTAVKRSSSTYQDATGLPLGRERYLDNVAGIRAQKELIEEIQQADRLMAAKRFEEAGEGLSALLKQYPDDYTALMVMAKCQLVLEKPAEGERFAHQAHLVYPGEPQALQVRGVARLQSGRYEAAYDDFTAYGQALPGNSNTIFFKGLSKDKMQQKEAAAAHYKNYLQQVQQGQKAQYAAKRLQEWGY